MKIIKSSFEELVTNEDLNKGKLILLASRPSVGKTYVCSNIMKKYADKYKWLYLNLEGGSFEQYYLKDFKEGVVNEYLSSVKIIKAIEKHVKDEKLKFVFIENWELVEDKNEWFIRMLRSFAIMKKLVIIVNSNLCRTLENRKNNLPKISDFKSMQSIYDGASKVYVLKNTYSEDDNNNIKKDLEFYKYKY